MKQALIWLVVVAFVTARRIHVSEGTTYQPPDKTDAVITKDNSVKTIFADMKTFEPGTERINPLQAERKVKAMTDEQRCMGCQMSMDFMSYYFVAKLVENKEFGLQPMELVKAVCTNKVFSGYKDFVRDVCKAIFVDFGHQKKASSYIFSIKTFEEGAKPQLHRENKFKVCEELELCPKHTPDPRRNRCQKCRASVRDLKAMISIESNPVLQTDRIDAMLDLWNRAAGLKHEAEEEYENIVGEFTSDKADWKKMTRTLVKLTPADLEGDSFERKMCLEWYEEEEDNWCYEDEARERRRKIREQKKKKKKKEEPKKEL